MRLRPGLLRDNSNKSDKKEKDAETNAYMAPTEEMHTAQCWIPSVQVKNNSNDNKSGKKEKDPV